MATKDTQNNEMLENLFLTSIEEVQSGQTGENFLRLKGRGKKSGKGKSIRSHSIERLEIRRARHARLEAKYGFQENDDE